MTLSLLVLLVLAPLTLQYAFSKGVGSQATEVGWALIENKSGGYGYDVENTKDQTISIYTHFGSRSSSEVAPYVLILEIRNQEGVTTFLQWQNGTVNSFVEQYRMTFQWQPSETGKYEVRNFVISNFTEPEMLSSVKTSRAQIS